MKCNRGFSLIKLFIFVVVLMAVIFGFTYFSGKDGLQIILSNLAYFQPFGSTIFKQTSEIKSFSVSDKKFIVKGNYLSKVEIWYSVNAVGSVSQEHKILEINAPSGINLWQTFDANIPCGPFSAVKIFVRGYDKSGAELAGDVLLPYSNVTDTYENVIKKGCPVDERVNTKYGLYVIDTYTGINISNPIFTINGKQFTGVLEFINFAESLPENSYKFSVTANGYKGLNNISLNMPSDLGNRVINLIPLKNTNEVTIQPKNKLRISGYLVDEIHNPVSGVLVSLENYNLKTTSRDDGFYYLDISPQTADLCTNNTIKFNKDGYQSQTITNFGSGYIKTDFVGTEVKNIITLKTGNGEVTFDQKYHMCP